jgi:cytoskeleton protein RodZ
MVNELEAIGLELRETRERLGLTLEEIERATRIRAHHLERIEAGDMAALPSRVQARGFLHNYAEFLGLDSDEILLRYAEALRARRPRRISPDGLLGAEKRPSVRVRSRLPRWLSADLFIAAGVVLAITALFVWGIGRVMSSSRQQVESVAEGLSTSTPIEASTAEGTEPPVALAPGLTSPPEPTLVETEGSVPEGTIEPAAPVNLRIQAVARAWLEVIVDGEVRFRGRVDPGQELVFQGESLIEMRTGNAAALRVSYNAGEPASMGERNQVLIRLWDAQGAISPTPTISPTASATSPATPSRTPTVTPMMTGTSEPGG